MPVNELEALPWIEVLHDQVTFRICGTSHGQRWVARMRPEVRNALWELLEAAGAQPGSDYATERGFARLLGLPKSRELDYTDAVFRRVGARGFVGLLLKLIIALPTLPLAIPLFALSPDPVVREIRACLHNAGHIPRAMRLWTLTRLPPHIRIELEKSSFSIVHSEEMARAAMSFARERGLKSLHLLVGLGHADEIAHFLKRIPMVEK
jgi:hypothetical protein